MSIPIAIRYEAQIARTSRARCQICGNQIDKGKTVLKVLGFRINHTIHQHCIGALLNLISDSEVIKAKCDTARASQGTIRLGIYERLGDKWRWKTIMKLNTKRDDTKEPQKGEETNEQRS